MLSCHLQNWPGILYYIVMNIILWHIHRNKTFNLYWLVSVISKAQFIMYYSGKIQHNMPIYMLLRINIPILPGKTNINDLLHPIEQPTLSVPDKNLTRSIYIYLIILVFSSTVRLQRPGRQQWPLPVLGWSAQNVRRGRRV